MKQKKETKKYFSTSEVAVCLGISRTAVLKKIYSGLLKAEKIGRNYIILKEDLEEIMGNKITPKQQEEINNVVKRAVREYGTTFQKLGEE